MDIHKLINRIVFLVGSLFAIQLNAASIGTYTFADNAIADQLISGQGQTYNGSSWYSGSGTSWLNFDPDAASPSWQPSASPGELTDTSTSTYLAAFNSSGSSQLELGFSQSTVINSAGSDIAFFFLWDQTNNDATVTINGISQSLSFSNVVDSQGIQQVANGVDWGGSSLSNVQLMAGVIDLDDYGFLQGDSLASSLSINLLSNNESNPMALALVAGLNSTNINPLPVPLPASLLLFLSGLISFTFARRK